MTPPRAEFPGPSPGGMGEALAAGKARLRRKVTAAFSGTWEPRSRAAERAS